MNDNTIIMTMMIRLEITKNNTIINILEITDKNGNLTVTRHVATILTN